jgi:hypothetical protein
MVTSVSGRWRCVVLGAILPLVPVACGARTDLVDDELPVAPDGGVDVRALDANKEAAFDALPPIDTSPTMDAAPPIDVSPPIDVLPPVDVATPTDGSACPVSGLTAYIVSDSTPAELYTLDPPTLTTTLLGPLGCSSTADPWTLTASSSGTVYVLYEDWNLYAVDPKTLICTEVASIAGQLSLTGNDGVTVAPDADGGESLYVYGPNASETTILAKGPLTTFTLAEVGAVTPVPSESPLDIRADAFGRIFGLGTDGDFVQIDPSTAALVAQDKTGFVSGGSWALLTYNDAIYFFAGGAVSQYDLATQTLTPVGNVGIEVVGASAAPCIH